MSPNQDTQCNITIFRNIIKSYIMPLIHNTSMEGPFSDSRKSKHCVTFDTIHKIRIYISTEENIYFILKRVIPFINEEKEFIEQIVSKVIYNDVYRKHSFHQIICDIIERVISIFMGHEHALTVYKLIQVYNKWSSEAEKDKKTSYTTGIDLKKSKDTGINFFNFKDSNSIKTLGANPDTILVLGKDGSILTVENIVPKLNNYKKNQDILAPITLADVAMWTNSSYKLAARLTSNGEILLFKDRKLIFAKRRSFWRSFPHESILGEILYGAASKEEQESRKAIYLTMLDIALSSHSACMGFFQEHQKSQDKFKKISSDFLLSSKDTADTTKLLATIINSRKFFEIPRRIRAALCIIGEALVVDSQGDILTDGVTLKLNGDVPTEESRTAIAKSLAKNGLGIKVSGEGYIEVYSRNNPPVYFA